MKEKIQKNMSGAAVYWEKKGEGFQNKKQSVCQKENTILALDRREGQVF